MAYSKEEIKETLKTLKEAYKIAIKSGGVVSYSINSGQGSSSVTTASIGSLRQEIQYWQNLLTEIEQFEAGSHVTAIRGLNGL